MSGGCARLDEIMSGKLKWLAGPVAAMAAHFVVVLELLQQIHWPSSIRNWLKNGIRQEIVNYFQPM
jgi:hypothetical protein